MGFVLITNIGFGWVYGGGAFMLLLAMSLYLWVFRLPTQKVKR
jgi:hypothetical protein